jgi:DNA glycosylase AlkZ-like
LLLDSADFALPRALERVGGIQAQYAPSTYVGLWSRLAGFERDDLDKALERRSVAQGTLMRVTIHLVSARDFPVLAEGVREQRRAWWLRAHGNRVDKGQIAAAAKKARSLLAKGPRRRSELVKELSADSATWNGVGMWLDLVRVPPSGTWEQRRADLYAVADDWLGPSEATKAQGLELLVRRYLSGFGPGSLKDVANWAGLPAALLKPIVANMKLRRFRDEQGGELLDLPRAPLPDPETSAPVRFLPVWDATLLVHARRTQILPEQYRARVFNTKTPQSMNTFLVDGQVAGTWKYDGARVHVEPFERLSREVKREVDEEAARLTEFHAKG